MLLYLCLALELNDAEAVVGKTVLRGDHTDGERVGALVEWVDTTDERPVATSPLFVVYASASDEAASFRLRSA